MNKEMGERHFIRRHEIYVKQEFFELIQSGEKTLELRVGSPQFSIISEGDSVIFTSGRGESIQVTITGIRRYNTIHEILQSEDISRLAPQMTDEDIKRASHSLFKESDGRQYGFLILQFEEVQA